jgi:creatinine amidohydrolase/Fe(II)-dependent formamide hydrolase-like protein
MGAMEQHGRHLPLNTDAVIAEELGRRIIARWGDEFDLWLLPTVFIGLSREHDWAPGTLSLSMQNFVALLKELAREIVRSLPTRNVLVVNGHGGNRGVLETLMHELYSELRLNTCVIHPFDLARAAPSRSGTDVHAGKDETSVMLAMAPHLVRRELIALAASDRPAHLASMIFDRGSASLADRRRRLAKRRDRDRRRFRGARTRSSRASSRDRAVLAQLLENQRGLHTSKNSRRPGGEGRQHAPVGVGKSAATPTTKKP